MSVERVVRKTGEVVWRVRWREGDSNRSKVLGRKRDAEAFDAEVRRRQRTGELRLLDGGKETLGDYVEQTWAHAHAAHLAPRTRQTYAWAYDHHIAPGSVPSSCVSSSPRSSPASRPTSSPPVSGPRHARRP